MITAVVSSCLLGKQVKYSGGHNLCTPLCQLLDEYKVNIIAVCPEMLAGLPTPRLPAEIHLGEVVDCQGQNLSQAFEQGAIQTLKIAQDNKADLVILKQNSPSCGTKHIYDGSFTGTLIDGQGITARRLKAEGFWVFGEDNLDEIEVFLRTCL